MDKCGEMCIIRYGSKKNTLYFVKGEWIMARRERFQTKLEIVKLASKMLIFFNYFSSVFSTKDLFASKPSVHTERHWWCSPLKLPSIAFTLIMLLGSTPETSCWDQVLWQPGFFNQFRLQNSLRTSWSSSALPREQVLQQCFPSLNWKRAWQSQDSERKSVD